MDFNNIPPISHTHTWRPGPLAYVQVSAWWLIWIALALATYVLRGTPLLPEILIAALLGLGGWIGLRTLELRVMRLTYDDGGVWWYQGYLPWKRGASLILWRDLGTVTFVMGFGAWITHSYPVTIMERFTDRPEIRLPPIWHGNQAAAEINQHLLMLLKGAMPTTG